MRDVILIICCALFNYCYSTEDVYVLMTTEEHDGTSKIQAITGDPNVWVSKLHAGETIVPLGMTGLGTDNLFQKLGFSYNMKRVIWSNAKIGDIEMAPALLGDRSLNHNIKKNNIYTSTEIGGIGFDWAANNIYWTDQVYNWLVMAPISGTTGMFSVVINTGLDKPGGLYVYPQRSYLFWTDYGATPKIERADMAGGNRIAIVTSGLVKPVAIDLDLSNGRLYWVDNGLHQIESCDVDGSDRQIFYQAPHLGIAAGITLYKKHLFVASSNNDHPYLYIWNTSNHSMETYNIKVKNVFDVKVFAEQNQPQLMSPCTQQRCSYMCVGKDNNIEAQCVCPLGYKLTDTTTCTDIGIRPTYIYSTATSLCRYNIWTPDMTIDELYHDCFNNFTSTQSSPSIGFMFKENYIYIAVGRDIAIVKGRFLLNKVVKAGMVPGMSMDWISKNIYWADEDGVIWVATAEGKYRQKIVTSLSRINGILADPVGGHLYWTCGGRNAHIGRSTLTGQTHTQFVTTDIQEPQQLTIDYTEDRLYWTDSEKKVIESINIDGTDRKIVVTLRNSVPFSIAVYQDHVAWTDKSIMNPGIHWAYKDGRKHGRSVQHTIAPYSIILYGEYSQPLTQTNQCHENNGGCEHLCLPTGLNSRICKCGIGYSLYTDQEHCVPATTTMTNPLLIFDSGAKTLYQMDVVTHDVNVIPVTDLRTPFAIDVDHDEGLIFWTDMSLKDLNKADLNGVNTKTIKHFTRRSKPEGLAVDTLTKTIFVVDIGYDKILSVDYNGRNEKVVISEGLSKPRDITLDKVNRMLYWTDWGSNPNIMASSYDGSNKRMLVQNNLVYPNGIVLDPNDHNILYWCDGKTGRVESVHTDGTHRELLGLSTGSQFIGITVMGSYLYITDWKDMYLQRISKQGGGHFEDVGDIVLVKPYGLTPIYKGREVIGENRTTTVPTTTTATTTPTTTVTETSLATTVTETFTTKEALPTTEKVYVKSTGYSPASSVAPHQDLLTVHSGQMNSTLVTIIAISVGGVVLLGIVITVGVICCSRNKRSRPELFSEPVYLTQQQPSGQPRMYTGMAAASPLAAGNTPPPYDFKPSKLECHDNNANNKLVENIYYSAHPDDTYCFIAENPPLQTSSPQEDPYLKPLSLR